MATWTAANWTNTTWIDKITLPTGTEYDIVDSEARSKIDSLGSYTAFLGVTTTNITDGTTSAVVSISGTDVTATVGNIVIVNNNSTTAGRIAQEFIYADGKWQLFGDISANNLGNLAYKNNASTKYTPAGKISTTSGTLSSKGQYTPAGTIDITTTAKVATIASTSTAPSAQNAGKFWKYTPAGGVTVTNTPSRTLTTASVLSSITGANLVSSVTAAPPNAVAPSDSVNYTHVTGHCLNLYYLTQSKGNAISSTSTTAVVTGVSVSNTTTASFSGTDVYVAHPTIDVPITATFSGTQGTLTVTGTVIKGAAFVGTTATITVS